MNEHLGRRDAAREHHRGSRWVEASEDYAAADRVAPLGIRDLECWAESAQVIGRVDEAIDVLARCFELRAQAGEVHEATRTAYWLWSAHVFTRGEFAIAAGWVERARGLAAARQAGEYGWPLIPEAYRCIAAGDYASAEAVLHRATELGLGCGDIDLVTIATTMRGRAILKLGSLERGLALLDEAMVRILTRTTSPRATSVMYCAAIGTCYEVHEIARAAEWSVALDRWLGELPRLGGAYFGNCRIYRALLMRLRGDWSRAAAELEQACRDLAVDGQLVVGHAWYELGESRRLQGDPGVEEAYQQAMVFGRVAQPGLALHRLSQGEVVAADTGLHRALAERHFAADRFALLPAAVEVGIAAGRVGSAKDALAEMERTATIYPTTAARSTVAAARGSLALAENRPTDALAHLRDAVNGWRQLGAPYEAATVGVRIAEACHALGDEDGVRMELHAANATFTRLGARPDADRTQNLLSDWLDPGSGLTPRETEVLRLIVDGQTNAQIATELHLSERTVHRHVSNILTKLGVHSRTAAATTAIQNHLT
ncbi:regulatory protein, luxR family [Actinokineospora alba]|uniref:Regulatory protein, luxR family n=1 Tax=Actinokineospora alba TaxID=504798 RepID=A0A1H0JU70_9PSEU|nr:helix-turn-helix transcriptional regulator [Actinokineospora alba]TDP68167.1 regulatory LuxR family protein [Actinokineospora alba]SDH93508.1 regulatory protein, luxR family [Actinokineospora alba]SDO47103.1 regulatory protein, luxR family [Actinokineospora alba]